VLVYLSAARLALPIRHFNFQRAAVVTT